MRSIFVVLSLLAVLAPATAASAETRPTLSLSRTSGQEGALVAFSGKGYTPGAEVTLVAGEHGIILFTVWADPSGERSDQFETLETAYLTAVERNKVDASAIASRSGKESNRVSFTYRPGGEDEASPETVDLSFDLAVRTAQSADVTYWALYGPPESEYTARRLTDPEEDGTYSFSTEVHAGSKLVIRVVQGKGTEDTQFGPFPGEPTRLIKDFGEVSFSKNVLLRLDAPLSSAADMKSQRTIESLEPPTDVPSTGGGGYRVPGTNSYWQ